MKKQFLPYNLALKLKELGFNEKSIAYYTADTHKLALIQGYNSLMFADYVHISNTIKATPAPLWQQAFDWFRDEFDYNVSIYGRKSMGYDYRINGVLIDSVRDTIVSNHVWKTYEEARVACLEKLIELCEKN